MIEKKSFEFNQTNNKRNLISEHDDSSIINKIDTYRIKLRYYRNFGDAIFIRIILIACSTFYIAQWSCYMKESNYLFAILINSVIIIDGIYVLIYRKVSIFQKKIIIEF